MRVDKRDFVTGIVLLGFSVLIIVQARMLPLMGRWETSPGIFPTFLGACLALFSIILIAQSLRPREYRPGLVIEREVVCRFLMIGGLLVGYLFLLPYLHFLWTSAIFLFVLMYLLRAGKPLMLGIIAVSTSFVIQYAFTTFFRVVLP